MKEFDSDKRDFFKSILMALVTAFVIELGGFQRMVFGQNTPLITDDFAILYSTQSRVVLRTINPGPGEQGHLDWLNANKPSGTTLLRLNKLALGAGHFNCPNLDTIIPYVGQKYLIPLSYGVACSVVDLTNTVVNVVLCAPELYQKSLPQTSLLVQKAANVGDIYNPLTRTITSPIQAGVVST